MIFIEIVSIKCDDIFFNNGQPCLFPFLVNHLSSYASCDQFFLIIKSIYRLHKHGGNEEVGI